MNMRLSSIYEIRNLSSERVYVGSAKNAFGRLYQHLWQLQQGTHCNKGMQDDWNANPTVKNWSFRILETGITADAVRFQESYWISIISPSYNISVVRPTKSREATVEKVLSMRAEGKSYRTIAKEVGKSLGWVSTIINHG